MTPENDLSSKGIKTIAARFIIAFNIYFPVKINFKVAFIYSFILKVSYYVIHAY